MTNTATTTYHRGVPSRIGTQKERRSVSANEEHPSPDKGCDRPANRHRRHHRAGRQRRSREGSLHEERYVDRDAEEHAPESEVPEHGNREDAVSEEAQRDHWVLDP